MKTRAAKTLTQKALDGTLDDQEMQAWKIYLQQHPDEQTLYEEQVAMSRLLQQVPEVEPPSNMTREILYAVRANRASRHTFRQKAESSLQGFFSRPVFCFATGFALGLLLLFAVPHFPTGSMSEDITSVSGTIGTASSERHNDVIDLNHVHGQILWIAESNHLTIHLKLNPEMPATIQLGELQKNMTLTSFKSARTNGIKEFNLTPDKLSFQLVSACELILDFSSGDQKASPLQFQIYQNGQLCYNKTIY
jgi:hypothetical protein